MEPPEGNSDVDVEWLDGPFPTKAGVAGRGADSDDDAEKAETTAPCHDASNRPVTRSSSSVFNGASRHAHLGEGCDGSRILHHRHREGMGASSSATAGTSGTSHRVPVAKRGGDDSSASGGSSTSIDAVHAAAGHSGPNKAAGGFLCYECGLAFHSVKELQLHMVRKTAWSNQGLIGSRVSCLVDNREWHEGLVTQYHKSGKHCVEYRRSGEKRWVNMLKTAFYIVERAQPTGGEVKEMEPDPTEGLAPIEKWHYQEDISPEFCMALSLLHRAYGCRVQETGHKTVGHTCVTDRDKVAAREVKGSLLYGELLPRGVNKAMGPRHLNAAKASTIYDLGMGTGKVAMQVFLQFPNLTRVYGIELSQARFELGEAALFALMELQPGAYAIKEHIPGQFISIETLAQDQDHEQQQQQQQQPSLAEGGGWREGGAGWEHLCRGPPGRTLEFACGNLFDVTDLAQADLVLLETDVSSDVHPQLSRFLTGMRKGSHALTYLDLRKMWSSLPFPYRQVEVNRSLSDRFPTSWSVHRGHHFFLWHKILPSLEGALQPQQLATSEDGEVLTATGVSDRRRDRQGHPLQPLCSRGISGVDVSGGGGRSDSLRSGSSGFSLGGAFAGVGLGSEGKGRRGRHREGGGEGFRLPFMSCLGLGRRTPSTSSPSALRSCERPPAARAEEGLVAAADGVEMGEPSTTAATRASGGHKERESSQEQEFGVSGGGGGGGGGGSSRSSSYDSSSRSSRPPPPPPPGGGSVGKG
ncbi:unnamed protein product [Ectocarpus sp. 6 AP-2014]